MSATVEKSLSDQMQELKISIELEACARSFKAKTETILDGTLPYLTKVQAIDGILDAIRYAGENSAHNGPQVVVYPNATHLLKGLICILGKQIPDKIVYTILQRTHAILSALDEGPFKDYDTWAAPFVAEICSTITGSLIKFRDEIRFVEICYKLFEFKFKMFKKCNIDIFVTSGIVSILANIITTHSMLKTVDESDREAFLIYAHKFLEGILDSCIGPDGLPSSVPEEIAFPVFNCVLNSTTTTIMVRGHSVIFRFLISGGLDLMSLKFANGKTGLHYVLLIAEHTLELCKNVESMECRDSILAVGGTLSMLRLVVFENREHIEYVDKIREGILNLIPIDSGDVSTPEQRSQVRKNHLKGIRALLRDLDAVDVEGADVVDATLAAHADVCVQT